MHVGKRGGKKKKWNTAVLAAMLVATAAVVGCHPQSACDTLDQKYAAAGSRRATWAWGRAATPAVQAGGAAPARAAAALLAAGLRHRLRRSVRLLDGPPAAADAAEDQRLLLIPTAEWGEAAGAGGAARLRVAGAGAAPARLRLHAHVSRRAPACDDRRLSRWLYNNHDKLRDCRFLTGDDLMTPEFQMYHALERRKEAELLAARAARAGLRLRPAALGADAAPRRELLALLHEGNDSFLFLDYDMWSDLDRVYVIDPPPDEDEIDESVRLADTWALSQVAPDVLQAFHRFEPSPTDLRKVLELEAAGSNVTEAACAVASNAARFEFWFDSKLKYDTSYLLDVFLCKSDPDKKEIAEVIPKMIKTVASQTKLSFEFNVSVFDVDCEDENSLTRKYIERAQSAHWARAAGTLAPGAGAGAAVATGAAAALGGALLLYAPAPPAPPALLAAPRPRHTARALRRFVSGFGWTRLAVLSDRSQLAAEIYESLRSFGDLILCDVPIDSDPESALRTLRMHEARIVFVDSNSSVAMSVLCAAGGRGMTPEAGYVWILREWRVADADVRCRREPFPSTHFTVSFWWRGGKVPCALDGSGDPAMRNALDATWPDRTWPPHAAPLADALSLLLHGFQNFLHEHPQRRYDIHSRTVPSLIWENLNKHPIEGVMQTLNLDEHGVRNHLAYVERWRGNRRDALAVWRVNDDKVTEVHTEGSIFQDPIPSDGSASCLFKSSSEAFSPRCYDGACFTGAAASLLALPALLLARRVRRRRAAARRRAVTARLLAPGAAAGALAGLLVERGALELRGVLGAGRFGVVRLAVLRAAGRARPVAAKALRDDSSPAEEREFLNEALTLAALRHERVVRLAGVVAGGGPPLVLMEHALFGDLLRYLRARRALAGSRAAEARHVSAAALTRLAREAAAALEFLAARGVVHRDVRAANCLVDARRSLKLADFGLARRAGAGAGAEYVSRRRGPLPALWLAPESLERGAFSAASDVWALGVLLLELATLGARPYGAWPPLRVLRHVGAGGHPPLPVDIAPETRRVLASCWRAARARPAAAELRAHLTAAEAALRPALGPLQAPDAAGAGRRGR